MPPTFPIARLNRYTPNFSGVTQKLTWCQQFGLQIFPKWGDADFLPPKSSVFRCFFGLDLDTEEQWLRVYGEDDNVPVHTGQGYTPASVVGSSDDSSISDDNNTEDLEDLNESQENNSDSDVDTDATTDLEM